MGIEDNVYQVYIEHHPGEVLHTGSIWECERWISKNGKMDTPYIIDRVTENKKKVPKAPKKPKVREVKSLF